MVVADALGTDWSHGEACRHLQPLVNLNNLIDGTSAKDTLHSTAVAGDLCTGKACGGSLIDPSAGVYSCTSEQKLEDARDFFKQYYESLESAGSPEHLARLAEAQKGLMTEGVYTHTMEELEFATKTAWRNAPRCIGRIQWKNLKVFDGRDAKTASDMFEVLMDQLKYATNGGNLRPAIAIFPPKQNGREFRCFSPQIVQYAGYRRGDEIIGDPANADLTTLLQRLGWKGKGGRFDVLPLLLQADSQNPEWFEIPPELVLQVDITHPQYKWFADLRLQWYAVPAVAGMRLECGGLEYTGCPFNGWYMGTEVGARDLCDPHRYNMLPTIAKRMGLDTGRSSTLWKDKALVEINLAVLHSYQLARVTMTDHHTASETFMQHHAMEVATRGGCPADWVWIVPPMSGSVCPVFHQEMVKYSLKPSYEYQAKPWVYDRYDRPCLKSQLEKFNTQNIRLSFSLLTKCVMALLALGKGKKARSTERPRVTVLYGTETGRSLIFSKQVAKTLQRNGCVPTVTCMSDYDVANLEEECHLLVVTSTFGSGEPPQNGRKFWSAINAMTNVDLKKMKYGILALGSRLYPDFCKFGKALEAFLIRNGATSICPLQEADEMKGQDSAYKKWASNVLQYYTKGDSSANVPEETKVFKCRFVNDQQITPSNKVLSSLHDAAIKLVGVKKVKELQAKGTTPKYIDMQFIGEENEKSDFYEPGDHLQIHPGNKRKDVQMVLSKLKVTQEQHTQPFLLEVFDSERKQWIPDERFPQPVSLVQTLTWFLDLMAPASDEFLQELAEITKQGEKNGFVSGVINSFTHKGVSNGISNGAPYIVPNDTFNGTSIVNGDVILAMTNGDVSSPEKPSDRMPLTYLEVLQMAKPQSTPAELVLSHIASTKPRKYSLSTAPIYEKKPRYQVTFKEIVYSRNGTQYKGLATGFMTGVQIGHKVHISISSAPNFRVSMAGTKPVLMIAQGTGIAPFRSFWRRKLAVRQNKHSTEATGPLHLFYGCRNPDIDFLYKKEITDMKSSGILDSVTMAFSRDKKTVKNIEMVGRLIHDQLGYVFYCGDVSHWDEICQLLSDVLQGYAHMSQADANEYLAEMKNDDRLTRDIFMD